MNREIWEGWTVQDFIDELTLQLDMIMSGQSRRKPLRSRAELEKRRKDNQPYYKKTIPEVVSRFAGCYGIKE
ncbi:MAG: hypothetical protein J6A79_04100 [Clostridia bacterium]|nr:hypothetical protein [Clostridia bacterium]